MQRRVSVPKGGLAAAKPRKPLAEGIRKKRPHGFFNRISDEDLIIHAQQIVDKGIRNRTRLQRLDGALYNNLHKRKLMDKVKFKERLRSWVSLSDGELLSYAQRILDQKKIIKKRELQKEDCSLYGVLYTRKLLDKLEFKEKRETRNWRSLSDEELVKYAQKLVSKGIKSRHGLDKEDSGLYQVLKRRNLLDKVEFKIKKKETRNWKVFSDAELLAYAQKVVDKGIKTGRRLRKEDRHLYDVLERRKLFDRITFKVKKKKTINWRTFSDGELVNLAQKLVDNNNLKNRRKLQMHDPRFYEALYKRKLLDKLEFQERKRNWASMTDGELVTYAQTIVNKGIKNITGLQKKVGGLVAVLRKRELLDRIEFEKKLRSWGSWANDELVSYAQKFIDEKGIKNRSALDKEDKGFYIILHKRKLLDQVFAPIEQSNRKQALDEIVDAVRSFK